MGTQLCDECGPYVRARYVITLPSGLILTYCGSHYTRHRIALERISARTYAIADI